MRINIEIGDIEAFIELTETNSFAKAAASLNLSQPALSRRIQKLEQELEHNEDITDDEVFNIISNITRMTERQLVYRQKVIEINRKLKER